MRSLDHALDACREGGGSPMSLAVWTVECDCGYEWKPSDFPRRCPSCNDPVVLGNVGRQILADLLRKPRTMFPASDNCEHSLGFDSKGGKWVCRACGQRVRLEVSQAVVVKCTSTVQRVATA